jgi:hypothetical protein
VRVFDFSRINSFDVGQRHSFEELVCQLARQESFPTQSIFKRVDGAGGDGGVEAYWTKPNGRETGYQAKYFLRSSDIDWSQIDKSVTQTLAYHPNVERYVIAFPCDLTDRTGNKRRGQSGWERWDSHVNKWKAQAERSGIRSVEFEAWTASELTGRLTGNASLSSFFFGDIQLTPNWFKAKLQDAVVALDDRFHPEDHVDVNVQQLFYVITRNDSCRRELTEVFEAIRKCLLPDDKLTSLAKNPSRSIVNGLRKAFAALLATEARITVDLQHSWEVKSWLDAARGLSVANNGLLQWFWKYEGSLEDHSPEKIELREPLKAARDLDAAVERLIGLLSTPYMEAEGARLAFVRGSAGSGKSHLMARCAQEAIEKRQPAVLLLGQRLNDSDFWTQVAQILGLPGRSANQILGNRMEGGHRSCHARFRKAPSGSRD